MQEASSIVCTLCTTSIETLIWSNKYRDVQEASSIVCTLCTASNKTLTRSNIYILYTKYIHYQLAKIGSWYIQPDTATADNCLPWPVTKLLIVYTVYRKFTHPCKLNEGVYNVYNELKHRNCGMCRKLFQLCVYIMYSLN